jgi:hypothetical protein
LPLGLTILRKSDAEKLGETGKGAESETGLHDERDQRDKQDLRIK